MGRRIRDSGKKSSTRIATLDKENEALTMRMAGLTFVAIGDRMGMTHARAQQLVKSAMQRREDSYNETLETVRKMELARLDRLFTAHYQNALGEDRDPNSAALCLKIMERRTAYLGLDAPAESRVAVTAAREIRDYDLSKLSPDELRAMRNALSKASTAAAPAIEHSANSDAPSATDVVVAVVTSGSNGNGT